MHEAGRVFCCSYEEVENLSIKTNAEILTQTQTMTFAARVYFSGGKCLRLANILGFILFISSSTLFRHNAVLFTFPLLLAVMFYAGRKQKIIIAAGCCIFIAAVRFVLYPYLGVQKPDKRIVETTCAPMTLIAEAVNKAPEKLDGDIIGFLHKVAPEEKWKDNYVTGSFNSVKFSGIRLLQRVFNLYSRVSGVLFKHLFWHSGILILAIIIFILTKSDFRKLCLSVPIISRIPSRDFRSSQGEKRG